MTTPAQELRTAAQTLRSAADHAGGDDWIADHYPEGTVVHPADSTTSIFRLAADGMRAAGTPHVLAPIGEYIATVSPALGLLFADWLDSAAVEAEQIGTDPRALAVARRINAATKAATG